MKVMAMDNIKPNRIKLPIPPDLNQPVQGGGPMGCGCGGLVGTLIIASLAMWVEGFVSMSSGVLLASIIVIVVSGFGGYKYGDKFIKNIAKAIKILWPF
jgi:hypothetical protein